MNTHIWTCIHSQLSLNWFIPDCLALKTFSRMHLNLLNFACSECLLFQASVVWHASYITAHTPLPLSRSRFEWATDRTEVILFTFPVTDVRIEANQFCKKHLMCYMHGISWLDGKSKVLECHRTNNINSRWSTRLYWHSLMQLLLFYHKHLEHYRFWLQKE